MSLLLVRHAIAVPAATWTRRDRDRPLTDAGRRQAEGLSEVCAAVPVDQIVCSPALRCVQTVEPVARARSIEVQPHPDLGEGRRGAARSLLASLSGTNVLVCTHMDVLDALVGGLIRDGLGLTPPPRWANAEAWLFDDHAPVPSLTRLTRTRPTGGR